MKGIMIRSLPVLLVFIMGCGKDPVTSGNLPPEAPASPTPVHNASGVSSGTTLRWECQDPEGDPVTYDVYLGQGQTPSLVSQNVSECSYRPANLSMGTSYFWKVSARDNHNHATDSPLWRFTTAANRPPAAPHAPFPSDGATNQSISATRLSWQCSDPDSDNLQYDLYLGTASIPPKVDSNLYDPGYDPGFLLPDTIYYWSVTARDAGGHSVEGPLWHFRTAPERITGVYRYLLGELIVGGVGGVGNFAFIAGSDQYGGVVLSVNVSDPAHPTAADDFPGLGAGNDMEVFPTRLFVAAGYGGLQILSSASPAHLAWIGECRSTYASALKVVGTYAYVISDWYDVLHIIDFSSPSSPVCVGSVSLPGTYPPQDIALCGSYAYIPSLSDGLRIVDISDPVHPAISGTYSTASDAKYIYVAGSYAYLGFMGAPPWRYLI